jgi:hypothetical protein
MAQRRSLCFLVETLGSIQGLTKYSPFLYHLKREVVVLRPAMSEQMNRKDLKYERQGE